MGNVDIITAILRQDMICLVILTAIGTLCVLHGLGK